MTLNTFLSGVVLYITQETYVPILNYEDMKGDTKYRLWPSDNMNLFSVAKQLSAFKWKDAIFSFLFSQVVQQH